ncbi:acyltransferase [Bradyrhizobium sp. INPA01-394B]|uniref:acyltransferase family protein n=1 Tax=Bradyrhizobium campsiandrae TaxID=1729892 RepID=UPI00165F1733|nr:acyltransferase [Bradyrhizobium campsiandrae]MBC9876990.1 acyltransferase [Bradyrhizobium campsiandrae]
MTDIEGARSPKGGIVPGIQYLRGFAAILVVIWHVNWLVSLPPSYGISPFALAETGLFGVAIFFVISGFIITIVSFGPIRATRTEFFVRRFVRIIPFMWVCVIGYNLLSMAGTARIDLLPGLRAMALWPIGELRPHVVWTLRLDFISSTLLALTMWRPGPLAYLLAAWFVAPPAWFAASRLLAWPELLQPESSSLALATVVGYGNIMMPNLQFGMGFVLGLLWLKAHPIVQNRFPAAFLLTLAATILATALVGATLSEDNGLRALWWTLFATLVVWLGIVSTEAPGPWHSLGMLLGNASYSIYLTHAATAVVLIQISARLHNPLPSALFVMMSVIVSILAGILIHWYIEQPLIAWCRRLGRRRSVVA